MRIMRIALIAVAAVAAVTPSPLLPQDGPADSSSFTRIGVMNIRSGKLAEGIEQLDKAIKLDPANALAYFWRGRAKTSIGDYGGAMADFDMTIKLEPNDPTAYVDRSNLKKQLKDDEGAKADMERAIQLHPPLAAPPKEVAPPKPPAQDPGEKTPPVKERPAVPAPPPPVAQQPVTPRKEPEAAPDMKGIPLSQRLIKTLDLSEDDIAADRYFDFGLVQLAQGKWKEAIDAFDKTIALAPKHFAAFVRRGTAKQWLGIQTFGKPLTIGVDLSSSPMINGAYEDYTKAVKLNSKCAEAYRQRGLLQALSGKWALAIADYDLAVKANPKFADAYDSRALVKKQTGDLQGALRDANKAVENVESAIPKDRWRFYRTRGNVKELLGDLKGAVADWKEAVRLFPDIGRELNPKIKSAQSGK